MKPVKAWHFSTADKCLRYGDNRIILKGITHRIKWPWTDENRKVWDGPSLCNAGLHGSKKIINALQYAPGPYIWRVELSGAMVVGDDKIAATERKYLWGLDATDILRRFARLCALDVIHLWYAPDIVIRYLKTGDESIRAAARDAAWDAAWDAARAEARDAAWAAARDAARDAAWDAARDAAWDAARAAARDAARARQQNRLTQMIIKKAP
ncbi:MAG: hypothetical protein KKE53_08530 [Proteobacteria bacterium]|nr:hypothetical protein [Pseudomonadota bacterium]